MSHDEPRYWLNPADRELQDERHRDEFAEVPAPADAMATRRGFLKAAGFTFAGAWAAGCQRAPLESAIPYLVKPDEITPGRAYFYASTCAGCSAACGLLAKVRDGRPIKLEGNPEHPLSRGGTCAAGQAALLGLYDSQRLTQPVRAGQPATWAAVDADLLGRFDALRGNGGAVRLLTSTMTSPTARAQARRFLSSFADGRHVVYDPISSSAILDAHEATHGVRVLPHYRFDRARAVVAIDADFLGTWISPVEFTRAWADGRRVESGRGAMSYHAQLESRLSITGSKADRRVRIAPADAGAALTALAARIAHLAGAAFDGGNGVPPGPAGAFDEMAAQLWEARGASLVVCGTQELADQVLCNFVNELLGNYGATLDLARPSYQRQGNDGDLAALRQELRDGRVAALIIAGVNPVYDLPDGAQLAADLAKVPLVVSFAERIDETAAHAHVVCPDHHALESWGDAEPVAGIVSVTQPSVGPIGETRALIETLAVWNRDPKPALDLVREHWAREIAPLASEGAAFDLFWDRSVERGVAELNAPPLAVGAFNRSAVRAAAPGAAPGSGEFALVLYPTVAMLDGRHAHNAWLQELPDPISKVAWDNYACLSPEAAASLGVADGDLLRVEAPAEGGGAARAIELPAFVQPGQHDRVVAIALGYGRKGTDRFARVGPQWFESRLTGGGRSVIGENAAPFIRATGGRLQYTTAVKVVRTAGARELASTQAHHALVSPPALAAAGAEPRPIVQEMTFAAWQEPGEAHEAHDARHEAELRGQELWPADHPYDGHRWAMAIDLSACTGCSACVVACQVENNVPVVGQDEVRRHREMHWIRLDRYYSGDGGDVDVVYEPMLCQHCENAPCETVCPVLATVHSEEGLNEQVYNRCVGTRYCANNCPYKVRRFNWFNYPREDRLQNLVLNPDVTVRSRGVMEKCSMCVQRIQEARMDAKARGVALADGDIQTACQQTCPAQAIVFGDINDPKSRVSALAGSRRAFQVLGELNVRPSITYLKVVRNRKETAGGSHG